MQNNRLKHFFELYVLGIFLDTSFGRHHDDRALVVQEDKMDL